MAGQKRTKTKHTGVYYNETTKKYDIKYNYKVYNPKTGKNDYKSKWVYNLATITAARAELSKLQTGGVKPQDKDITLKGAFDLWQTKAAANDYSPATVQNTTDQFKMMTKFISPDFRVRDIDEEIYLKLSADCRKHGYAEETLHNINSCFRKLVRLTYTRRLIAENPLDFFDNIRTKQKQDYALIPVEDFYEIDKYFKENKFWRLGVNNYPKYRLMFNLLFYTGMRIGECLALQYDDFEPFSYYRKGEEPSIRLVPSSSDTEGKHLRGTRVKITKAYLTEFKITKDPKNIKHRSVPLSPAPERLYMRLKEEHLMAGGKMEDKVFDWGHSACNQALQKACEKLGLEKYSCHDFRHTFISNLIRKGVPITVIEKVSGDTAETILKRYAHLFEEDEVMVLIAMQDL